MKIYEIGTGYTPIPAQISAATEIVVEELTKAMLKQNVPVEIIDVAADYRMEHHLPIRQVRVPKQFSRTDVQLGIMHKLKRVAYSVALAVELKKILKETRERVVLHFHNQYNLFFFLKLVPQKLRHRCIVAYTNHSGVWRLPWDTVEGTIRKRYFQEAAGMQQADLVFVLNEETRETIIDKIRVPGERVVLIGNGVNTDVYCPLTTEEKSRIRSQYGLENRRVILQVGSVYENKGQLRTVENLLPLLKKYPDLVYAYLGGIVDEAYQGQIFEFTKEHELEDQVRYLGMVSPGETLNNIYNVAEATILASRYESFGMVVIESFSAGVPVLLDQNGPVHLGDGGVTYSEVNFEQDIEQFLNSDTTQISKKARMNAEVQYSWDKIARDYMDAFAQFGGQV